MMVAKEGGVNARRVMVVHESLSALTGIETVETESGRSLHFDAYAALVVQHVVLLPRNVSPLVISWNLLATVTCSTSITSSHLTEGCPTNNDCTVLY